MNKKIINVLLFSLVTLFFISCHEPITEFEPIMSNRLSKSQADNLVENTFYPDKNKSAIFGFDYILPPNASIKTMDNKIFKVDYPSWCFLIDYEYLIMNWPRKTKLVFINSNTGEITAFKTNYNIKEFNQMDTVFYKWKKQSKMVPRFNFSSTPAYKTCDGFNIFIENIEKDVILRISAAPGDLHLSNKWSEFNLDQIDFSSLNIHLDFYYYLPDNYTSILPYYCNNGLKKIYRPSEWWGKNGKVKIKIVASDENNYWISMVFENIVFNSYGCKVTLNKLVVPKIKLAVDNQ